jgi:hypothetical protein
MHVPSGLLTSTSQASSASDPSEHAFSGFDALGVAMSLIGVAGTLFVFAAFNMLHRVAPVKVRKR